MLIARRFSEAQRPESLAREKGEPSREPQATFLLIIGMRDMPSTFTFTYTPSHHRHTSHLSTIPFVSDGLTATSPSYLSVRSERFELYYAIYRCYLSALYPPRPLKDAGTIYYLFYQRMSSDFVQRTIISRRERS